MSADPTMPRQLPPQVERALRERLGWCARPNPVDCYMAVGDALVETASGPGRPLYPPEPDIDDLGHL
jgi:hypothetical protein